jgi:hypothetical protein
MFFPLDPTPQPSAEWTQLTNHERLELVVNVTESGIFSALLEPVTALSTGFVYVELVTPLSAAERGVKLRDYESLLKSSIDESLTVWCEPVGDKSALRKLRGIEVKAI